MHLRAVIKCDIMRVIVPAALVLTQEGPKASEKSYLTIRLWVIGRGEHVGYL